MVFLSPVKIFCLGSKKSVIFSRIGVIGDKGLDGNLPVPSASLACELAVSAPSGLSVPAFVLVPTVDRIDLSVPVLSSPWRPVPIWTLEPAPLLVLACPGFLSLTVSVPFRCSLVLKASVWKASIHSVPNPFPSGLKVFQGDF